MRIDTTECVYTYRRIGIEQTETSRGIRDAVGDRCENIHEGSRKFATAESAVYFVCKHGRGCIRARSHFDALKTRRQKEEERLYIKRMQNNARWQFGENVVLPL